MTNRRYVQLDIAKGIGILLVITGHIQYISDGFRNFIVAFHIPLFFIIAGMLIRINREEKKSLAKTMMKKCRSILQPYFIFSLIFIVAQYVAYRIGSTITLELVKQNIFLTVTFFGMSVLWFLAALFVGEMAFLVVYKSSRGKWTAPVLLLWLVFSCLANRYMQSKGAFFDMRAYGSYLRYFLQTLVRIGIIVFFVGAGFYLWRLKEKLTLSFPVSLLSGAAALALTVIISQKNEGVDLHFLVFNNEALYFAGAILGSLGILLLSNALAVWERFLPLKILAFYGKNSLIVMMTHVDTYLMYASTIIIMHFNPDITEYKGNVTFCVELFMLVSCVEAAVVVLMNHFCPWMVGRKGEKQNGCDQKISGV